jgi:hypothetical protein
MKSSQVIIIVIIIMAIILSTIKLLLGPTRKVVLLPSESIRSHNTRPISLDTLASPECSVIEALFVTEHRHARHCHAQRTLVHEREDHLPQLARQSTLGHTTQRHDAALHVVACIGVPSWRVVRTPWPLFLMKRNFEARVSLFGRLASI